MSRVSQTLLPNTQYAYEVVGDAVAVQGRHILTIAIHTANLTGDVTLEGTLHDDPQDGDWFLLCDPFIFPTIEQSEAAQSHAVTIKGAFSFIRATLTRPDLVEDLFALGSYGCVDRILLNA